MAHRFSLVTPGPRREQHPPLDHREGLAGKRSSPLPLNLFYNTGIATYVWVLTNRKPEHRRGKVQLIDAAAWHRPLRKNLGKKNCELGEDDIERICDAFLAFEETERSRIFDNEAFGYRKVTVERPLRIEGAEKRAYKAAEIRKLKQEGRRGEDTLPVIKRIHKRAEADPLHGLFEDTVNGRTVVVEYEPDSELRDTEQIPLQEEGGIDAFLKREVLPYAPDAWYRPATVKIGYEISFNRYFYKPEPMRTLAEIRAGHPGAGAGDGWPGSRNRRSAGQPEDSSCRFRTGVTMARADLLLKLVRASRQGDEQQVRKIVEALAAEERAKNHNILAERLLAQLQIDNGRDRQMPPHAPRALAGPLLAETVARRRLDDLLLPPVAEEIIRELVAEPHRADLLRSYNIEPRNRVLLAGPPGNGKTTLAEALANALSVPFLVVRYEAVIGSYLGRDGPPAHRTGLRAGPVAPLRPVLRRVRCRREGTGRPATRPARSSAWSARCCFRSMPSPAMSWRWRRATIPSSWTGRLWRRFQVRVELPPPTRGQIEEWFRRFEKRHGHTLGLSPRSLAERLRGLSFAEVEDFGTDVLRKIVLGQPDADVGKVVESRLRHWKSRFKPERAHPVGDSP